MSTIKKFTSIAVLLTTLLGGVATISSCSDDGPSAPSTQITQVQVYKENDGCYELHARYEFAYDSRKRVSNIIGSGNTQEVSYTYGTNSITYRWEGYGEDSLLFVDRFNADLKSGRVNVGTSDLKRVV